MIKSDMFYGGIPTIKEYRDMDIPSIIREHLLTKGTWSRNNHKDDSPYPINKVVFPKDLISSGLFVYELKDNPTNRRAIEYYCERWAQIHQIMDQKGLIHIPEDLWKEADKKNKEFTRGRDRKTKVK